MPFLNDKLFIFLGKLLRARELVHTKAVRFTKLDGIGNVEDGFTTTVADVDVNGQVIIAVEEAVAVLLENPWPGTLG